MINELNVAVIHDIKNQLAELALMLERRGGCDQEKAIAFGASQRLSGLLLAHLQYGGLLTANIDAGSPGDIVQELVVAHRSLFPGIDISIHGESAPPFWFFDAALLRLALDNVMHNACRHARSSVRVEALKDGDFLLFRIIDDGPGFPSEMLKENPGNAPIPASRHGTGLGMYLAAKIAQLHQNDGKSGSIEIGNNDGAVFTLRLP